LAAGIDLGDAILSFIGDTTQLDAAFAKVETGAQASLQPAAKEAENVSAAVGQIGATATAASAAAQTAFENMVGKGKLADDMTQEFNKGLVDAIANGKAAGEGISEGMEKGALAATSGSEKIRVLDEAIGIRLPRGVTRFISELVPLGAVMDAAFAASVVFIVIEALSKGIEKLIEWREEAHKIELAQLDFGTAVASSFETLDEKLLRAEIKADELRGDHLAALRKELELIDHQSMADLEHQFGVLAAAADAVFKQLETSWFTFNLGSKGAEDALRDFKAQYDFLLATGQKKEAADLLAGTLQSAKDTLTIMNQIKALGITGFTDVDPRTEMLDEKHTQALQLQEQLKQRGASFDEKSFKAQQDLVTVLQAQANAQDQIQKIGGIEKENKTTEEVKREAKEQSEALKKRDKEVIDSVNERIHEEQALYKRDTDAALAETERQLKASKDAEKQKLADAVQSERERIKNLQEEGKQELEAVKEDYSQQEKAIEQLGKDKVISETESSKRLLGVYTNEKNQALAILQDLLSKEKAMLVKAQGELSAAKNNPFISPEQVRQAEALVGQIQRAITDTESKIQKTKADFQARELAQDRTYYGVVLNLAVASGNRLLAEKIRENHASLLAAQAQLAEAKARGLDTTAIEKQIHSLQKSEKEFIKETGAVNKLHAAANGLFSTRASWDSFFSQLTSGAFKTGEAFKQLGAEVVASFAESLEAALSGSQGFGQAMEQMLKSALAALAAHAFVKVAEEIAFAFSDLANPFMAWHAGFHFKAAAMWGAVGALAGVGAAAIPSGGGSSAGSKSTGTPGPTGAAAVGASAPVQTINVAHLATGGLVTRPTLAVVGDAAGGGSQREAVLPLNDSRTRRELAKAFGQGTVIHVHVEGMISPDNLHKVMNQMSREVNGGKARLLASNSIRVTRRS